MVEVEADNQGQPPFLHRAYTVLTHETVTPQDLRELADILESAQGIHASRQQVATSIQTKLPTLRALADLILSSKGATAAQWIAALLLLIQIVVRPKN